MYKALSVAFGALMVSGCATNVDYKIVSVPEEGGTRFEKITRETDRVVGPAIEEIASASESSSEESQERLRFSIARYLAVSANGKKVAFFSEKNDNRNIYVKGLGAEQGILQRTFRNSQTLWGVALSPDGESIAFSDFRNNSWDIYSVNANAGAAVRQITSSSSHEYLPIYSPDGTVVLFSQTENQTGKDGTISSKSYLWTYELRNGALVQYVEAKAPSYMPDSKSVVVSRLNKDTGYNELWLINLENGQEFSIASSAERGFDMPAVSPDGKKILFVSTSESENISPNLDLYMISIDGADLRQLTFHPGHDVSPQWAGNDSVVFLSQRGTENGEWNVWRMNLQQVVNQ